ncbi:MAG TPA: NAD-dependent succinate-semialdehyde dehydrogenase [Devosiaceae bacterium]|jgi:succinate-semialdehyde dehydrogenase/glutarate-semialdehyde dehydrogenase
MTEVGVKQLLREQCYVGGQWIGDPVDAVLEPAAGSVVARVPRFGAGEATAAVEAAAEAFPSWSKRTAKDRSAILKRWFQLIVDHRAELGQLITREQGKPLAEALGEVDYGAGFVEFYAEEAKRIYGETIPTHRADARLSVIPQAAGVVSAITPWNFPLAMITRKCAPALAAGCTVVCKPAEDTPLTALALAGLAEEAGVPPGVFNVITGDPVAIGGVLTRHEAVRVITFTGSTEVGKLLMRQAADGVKKISLELGGNAPFLVFDDADLDVAVQGAMASKFRNMGQTCVCANRILVQVGVHDAFVKKLSEAVGKLVVGHGMSEGTTQGPLINTQAIDKVESHLADAVRKGGSIMVGGRRHALGGTFFEPTILTGVTDDMLVSQEETFGPVASIIRFDTEEEGVSRANASPYGLAAYFYATRYDRIVRVMEGLEAGMVGVNSGLISTELVPFGGVKQSGLGREGGRQGIEEFVERKYVLLGGLI